MLEHTFDKICRIMLLFEWDNHKSHTKYWPQLPRLFLFNLFKISKNSFNVIHQLKLWQKWWYNRKWLRKIWWPCDFCKATWVKESRVSVCRWVCVWGVCVWGWGVCVSVTTNLFSAHFVSVIIVIITMKLQWDVLLFLLSHTQYWNDSSSDA